MRSEVAGLVLTRHFRQSNLQIALSLWGPNLQTLQPPQCPPHHEARPLRVLLSPTMPRLAFALATTAMLLPAGQANLYCPQADDMEGGSSATIVDRGYSIYGQGYVNGKAA